MFLFRHDGCRFNYSNNYIAAFNVQVRISSKSFVIYITKRPINYPLLDLICIFVYEVIW